VHSRTQVVHSELTRFRVFLPTDQITQDGGMPRRTPSIRRHRRHGAVLRHVDRRDLELDGWRTTLEYRENHRRGRDGRLLEVREMWHAEAERWAGSDRRLVDPVGGDRRRVEVIAATADSVEAAWARLRLEAELADVRVDAVVPASPSG
jgi:hypothetical protein